MQSIKKEVANMIYYISDLHFSQVIVYTKIAFVAVSFLAKNPSGGMLAPKTFNNPFNAPPGPINCLYASTIATLDTIAGR